MWLKHPAISCYWLIDSATYMLTKIYLPAISGTLKYIFTHWETVKSAPSTQIVHYVHYNRLTHCTFMAAIQTVRTYIRMYVCMYIDFGPHSVCKCGVECTHCAKQLTGSLNQGCWDDLLTWSHHSEVHHFEVVARQHNSNDVLTDVMDISLHCCQDDSPQVTILTTRTKQEDWIPQVITNH